MVGLFRIYNSATFTTWLSLLIRIGGLTFLLPIILTRLNVHEVLVWQMLASITAMTLWLDFGFSPTFSRLIAFARGGGRLADLDQMARNPADAADSTAMPLNMGDVIGTQNFIYVCMALAALVVMSAIGTWTLSGPIGGLDDPNEGWVAWGVTGASSLVMLLNGANTSFLLGFDRIAVMRRFEGLIGGLQIASTIVVVLLGGKLVAISLIYGFWAVASAGVNFMLVRRLMRAEQIKKRGLNNQILQKVWPVAWRSGVGILFSTGIIQGSGLVMPQIASAADAAAYLLALRLFTTIAQLCQAPFYTKLPAMAKARAEGQEATVIALATRGMSIALWVYVAGVFAVMAIAPPALQFISSSVYLPGFQLSSLLAFAFFAERYGAMHMQIYTLTNHVIWHIVNGATGALTILSFVLFWPVVGSIAMPIAILIGYVGFLDIYISGKSVRSLRVSRGKFERETSLFPGITLVLFLFFYYFSFGRLN